MSEKLIPTPRTDALIDAQNETDVGLSEGWHQLRDLARQLERELAEARSASTPSKELKDACELLLDYRRRVGSLSFQLEKADTYINRIDQALDKMLDEPVSSTAQPEAGALDSQRIDWLYHQHKHRLAMAFDWPYIPDSPYGLRAKLDEMARSATTAPKA